MAALLHGMRIRCLSVVVWSCVPRIFFGWYIVAAAVGLQMLGAGLMTNAYGAYVVQLRNEFAWSLTLLALASSLSRLESGVLGPPQGWLIDRFGPRAVAVAGVLIFGLGMMAFAAISSEVSFVLTYLVLSIGAGLAGYMTLSVAVVNWFQRLRGTALGIMGLGFGLGSLVLPALVWSMETFGWRATSFGSGVLVILLGLPMAALLRRRPEDYGLQVDGGSPSGPLTANQRRRAAEEAEVDFTIGEALRAPSFWYLSLGHAAALLIVSAVIVQFIAYMTESLQFSLELAAMMAVLLTGMQMAGQVAGGFLGDRMNKRLLCILCMVAHCAGLLVLASATALWMVIAFTALHGLAWGIRGPMMQAIRADYFGRRSFGKVMGFSSLIVMLGSISGPLLVAVIYDGTGNFALGFQVLAALAALGSVFFLFATKPRPPRRVLEAAPPAPAGAAA